jgi:membrane protein DedA with SNARE-associated domain
MESAMLSAVDAAATAGCALLLLMLALPPAPGSSLLPSAGMLIIAAM